MRQLLFIGPTFYDYHIVIKKGFEDMGFQVDYYDDRPSVSNVSKALLRINSKILKKSIQNYFESILNLTKNKAYDIVFVLYGQSFSKEMLLKLKKSQPKAYFVFYMFDPLCSMPNRKELVDIFDDCYSFDLEDCKANPNFKFLPLFYSKKKFVAEPLSYDVCAIITMMPGKYNLMTSMISQLSNKGLSIYKHFYLQSRFVWLYYRKKYDEFKKSKLNEFVFKRLPRLENDSVVSKSKYILDCPKEGQSGLTIRVFEALFANKKLITTNKSIVNYDFYCPENIYIFDKEIDFNNIFFKSEYKPIPQRIKDNYCLKNWINKLLQNYYLRGGER